MKLSTKIINEAKQIASGFFHMNAKHADRYGFSVRDNEIYYGELLYPSEKENRVECILELATGNIRPAKDS